MRVLVTGGAGFIGSHTASTLARAGHVPVSYDNLSEGHRHAVRWGPLIVGDLADGDLLRRVLVDEGIEAVIHFAASAYVGESAANPRKYFRNNVANTLNLLDAMQDVGVAPIVFSSSCATYGPPERVPLDETHPQRPISPYGESKMMAERMLHWHGRAYDLQWVALRYFNAAGADPDGEIGEEHDPETHLIPLAIGAALGTAPPLRVFGTDYPTPDGTCIRDYIHVSDLAQAHVRALDYLVGGGMSAAINLGTGQGHSVREVVRTVEAVSGRRVPVVEGERRAGDPPVLVADARRAYELLDWAPAYPSLEVMVETAWHWFGSRSQTLKDRVATRDTARSERRTAAKGSRSRAVNLGRIIS